MRLAGTIVRCAGSFRAGKGGYNPRIHYGKIVFLQRGYRVAKEQMVVRQGIGLANYVTEKR